MTPVIKWMFLAQFILSFSIVFSLIFTLIVIRRGGLKVKKMFSKMKFRAEKPFPQVDVCSDNSCKRLEGKMVAYMRKVLAFENNKIEAESVIDQLKLQLTVHHREEMTFEEGRHEMMQCLRTSLVKHPDDLRGRRRANQARQILVYQVYAVDRTNDVDFDIGYKIETFFEEMKDFVLFNKEIKHIYKGVTIIFNCIKALLVLGLDVYSDIAILLVMIYCSDQVAHLLKLVRLEETDYEPNCFANTTSLLKELIREHVVLARVDGQLVLIQNIFNKYIFQLKFVFIMTTLQQGLKATNISELYMAQGFSGNLFSLFLFGVNFLASPILLLYQLPLREFALQDSKKEVPSADKYTKEISLDRNRYQGSIIEAFIESLNSCKTQISFYLAFSYIAGTPAYGGSEEIMSKVLKDSSEIFTFKKVGWHGIPVLAFSALMSLISITLAQFKLYTTRHGYDMSIMGKTFYLISTLIATYVKLASQIMLYTIYIIAVMDPTNSDYQFLVLQFPNMIIFYLQLQTISVINWWTASTKVPDSGYSLAANIGKIWPTTSNLCNETSRLRMQRLKAPYVKRFELEGMPKLLEEILKPFKQILKNKNILWYLNIVIPFFGIFSYFRLNLAPHQYSFKSQQLSRNKFRSRFLLNIGLNFLLITCILMLGWLFLLFEEEKLDLEKQPATRNALYIWLSLIPCYIVALLMFKTYYDYFHVWRKEHVVVGYEFTENFEPGSEWDQKHFQGRWVAHSDNSFVPQQCSSDKEMSINDRPEETIPLAVLQITDLNTEDREVQDDATRIENLTEENYLEKVINLLNSGYEINSKDEDNFTLLHRAAMNNQLDTVKYLIKEGADVDERGGQGGQSALHEAISHGHLGIVTILVNEGSAQIFMRNNNGQNAFRIARIGTHQAIRRFLWSKNPLCDWKIYALLFLHVMSIVGLVMIMFDHLYIEAFIYMFC